MNCSRYFDSYRNSVPLSEYRFNRWRTPGTPFGAIFVLPFWKGSKFQIYLKFEGQVEQVCPHGFMQKRNLYLSPIKSVNFSLGALSKISPLSVDFMALFWSDKVSPIFLKFGQDVGERLDFWFPKKLIEYIHKQKSHSSILVMHQNSIFSHFSVLSTSGFLL